MSETSYTPYHPRWHRTRLSTYWWLERGPYLAFILREVSSVFVAWTVAFLLMLIRAVSQGPDAYTEFLKWSASPVVIAINVITLFFLFVHAITWFNLAPKALVARFRGKRVPGWVIAGSNYAAWLVASIIVGWVILK